MANSAFNHSPSITVPTGASTNDAVIRWDGTGGLTLQNSVLIVSDAGVISGVTQISIDNIRIYDNSIISTNSNGSISITPDGTGSVAISKADINGGTIDGTAIGVSTASTIAGTTITAATSVTTPILLLSGSSNSLTLDVGNSVAAYTVILPDAAPTANDKILKTSGGSPYSQLVWGDAGGGNAFTNDVTITSGNLVMATAGKGIDFSATANSSGTMANELLDDYEEGTWTPEIWDNTNSDGSAGYTTQVGRYIKIGKMVYCVAQMTTNSLSGLTTSHYMKIGNLPFTSAAVNGLKPGVLNCSYAYSLDLNIAGGSLGGYVEANASHVSTRQWDWTGGTQAFLISEWTSNGQAIFDFCYQAAS